MKDFTRGCPNDFTKYCPNHGKLTIWRRYPDGTEECQCWDCTQKREAEEKRNE